MSLHWDNIKATKKRRVLRQALKSSRGWAEAGLRCPFWLHKSVSIPFVPVNVNCTEIVCRDKTADPLFFFSFFSKWQKHWEILLKICCLCTKWACNHIDHRGRKCSVLPVNLFMASKKNWILSAFAPWMFRGNCACTKLLSSVSRWASYCWWWHSPRPQSKFTAQQSTASGLFWSWFVWRTQKLEDLLY